MVASFLEKVIELLKPVFSHWGYLFVFVGVFLESLFLTSWAAPGTVILLLGGFYAAGGDLNPILVGLVAFGAATAGDLLGYYLGVKGGHRILHRYQGSKKVGDNLNRSERYFRRYGGRTLLFGKWVAGIKAFIPIMAGVGSMPLGKFLGYTLAGNMLWTAGIFTAGYFFGENWQYIDRALNFLGWGLLIILAVALTAMAVVRKRARSKADGGSGVASGGSEIDHGGEG